MRVMETVIMEDMQSILDEIKCSKKRINVADARRALELAASRIFNIVYPTRCEMVKEDPICKGNAIILFLPMELKIVGEFDNILLINETDMKVYEYTVGHRLIYCIKMRGVRKPFRAKTYRKFIFGIRSQGVEIDTIALNRSQRNTEGDRTFIVGYALSRLKEQYGIEMNSEDLDGVDVFKVRTERGVGIFIEEAEKYISRGADVKFIKKDGTEVGKPLPYEEISNLKGIVSVVEQYNEMLITMLIEEKDKEGIFELVFWKELFGGARFVIREYEETKGELREVRNRRRRGTIDFKKADVKGMFLDLRSAELTLP